MALLFTVKNNKVVPTAETLMINEFKKLWNRDESKDKHNAILEFSYIEFMVSPLETNPYREYSDDLKEDRILLGVFGSNEVNIDSDVTAAMNLYKELLFNANVALELYDSIVVAIRGLSKFFNEVDLSERSLTTNAPIYKPKDITSAVAEAEKLLTSFDKLKEKVITNQYTATRIKAGKHISYFATKKSAV